MHLMLTIKIVDLSINALSPNHGVPVRPIVISSTINPRPCVCWTHQRCRRRSVGEIDINIPRDAIYLTAIGKLPILLIGNTRRSGLLRHEILSDPLRPARPDENLISELRCPPVLVSINTRFVSLRGNSIAERLCKAAKLRGAKAALRVIFQIVENGECELRRRKPGRLQLSENMSRLALGAGCRTCSFRGVGVKIHTKGDAVCLSSPHIFQEIVIILARIIAAIPTSDNRKRNAISLNFRPIDLPLMLRHVNAHACRIRNLHNLRFARRLLSVGV